MFLQARNSLTLIKIKIKSVPPYPVPQGHLPGDRLEQTSPHHATSGQLS